MQPQAAPTPSLPGGLPFLGALPALARDPLAVFQRARAFGDVVRLPVPSRHPLFLIAQPAHIRHVLQENHANYRRTPFHDRLKAVLGEGLATSEGALWQRQRPLLQPAFRAERVRRFIATMVAVANDTAQRWAAAAEAARTLDVSQEMSGLALDIAVRCMFGGEPQGGDAEISSAVHQAQDWIAERFWSLAPNWTERLPVPANLRFRRALATLDATVQRIIRARLAAGEPGDDLLGMLLAAQAQDRAGIDARQVRDEVMTMLLAGHETSAAALTWVWHVLAQNPPAASAVRAELSARLDGKAPARADDLAQLDTTQATIQEAMRLYPPVGWFGRLAAGPDRIGGHDIPAGAILVLSPWVVQRDPSLWPEPERFDTSRFTSGAPRPLPYAYFPFGGGPRTCIGNHFAMTEMLCVLSVLVPRFNLRHAYPAEVRPELLITLRPAGGLPMTLTKVSNETSQSTP